MQAKFIVVEGLEGAGKSSVIEVIKNQLLLLKVDQVVTTREPGGTPLSEKIRSLVKTVNDNEEIMPVSELLLMVACRVQLVENVIKPALKNNQWVLSDRFSWSTFAYQGAGRGLGLDRVDQLHQLALGGFKPDFTIYLDIDPVIGLERAKKRGELDRFELQQIEFFNKAREAYLTLLEAENSAVKIDASQPMDVVHQQVKDQIINYCRLK
ncbi:MAG: dTMP kinase [Methylococcales bacterium]|nr:dTMP kinase [Methylococcales bacterium]MBT7409840.1 dTMP kinase [Methylococcales bacterium]